MSISGPHPRATGGQYYLVLNGSLELDAGSYSAWSTVFVSWDDAPLAFKAGPKGLEALLAAVPQAGTVERRDSRASRVAR